MHILRNDGPHELFVRADRVGTASGRDFNNAGRAVADERGADQKDDEHDSPGISAQEQPRGAAGASWAWPAIGAGALSNAVGRR